MLILTVNTQIPIRLDRYLKNLYPALTQGLLQKALRLGQIKVNDKKSAANFRLVDLDIISIHNDKLKLQDNRSSIKSFSVSVITLADKILHDYLIYSDEEFIAINKPAGLATQGGSKINFSINDALCYLNQNTYDLRLVHRLDKETSGILLIAKNYLASIKLTKAFQEKKIQKTYLAITFGCPNKTSGEISGLIGKNKNGAFELVQDDLINGKMAITQYKLLKTIGKCSLIEFKPLTGRTHQIRFHAQSLNCPIVGDSKYGSLESKSFSKNMLLHASNVILSCEIFGKLIKIDAKLPYYFIN